MFNFWPGRQCNVCHRMVHYDCDTMGQSSLDSSSTHTGAPTAGSGAEESQTTSYTCPLCRNKGSTTPSEVLSATASLRTSPFVGGAGSSDIASTSPSLGEDTQLNVSSSTASATPSQPSLAFTRASLESADAEKQKNIPIPPTLKSPRNEKPGAVGATGRPHKSVGRPVGSLTKSKSISLGVGELSKRRPKTEISESMRTKVCVYMIEYAFVKYQIHILFYCSLPARLL